MPLRHRLSFTMVGQRAELVDESVEDAHPSRDDEPRDYFYYRYMKGHPVFNVKTDASNGNERALRYLREDPPLDQSVVSQRKDPDQYPEITYLGNEYSKIRLFREWNIGRATQPRRPQPTDLPADFLREDAANIALVLNDLEHRSNLRGSLIEKLRSADESIVDLSTRVLGGTIQLFLRYSGLDLRSCHSPLGWNVPLFVPVGCSLSPGAPASRLSGRTRS